MTAPRVSVVMPVRNGERFLEEAIRSICEQTFADFELIALDDGSSDATPGILARAAARDGRVRVEILGAVGLIAALNRGLSLSRGDFVARMDADDIALPQRLERQIEVLERHPNVAALGSACRIIDEEGRALELVSQPLTPAAIRAELWRRNCLMHPSVTMRRRLALEVGGYRPAFLMCEDYDLWLRLADTADLMNLAEPLMAYRGHGGQSTWSRTEQRILSELGAVAAARLRQRGLPDLGSGPEPVDRERLRAMGLAAASIREAVAVRAVGTALTAMALGHGEAAREALDTALRTGGLGPIARARCWWLAARLRWLPGARAGG